MGKQLSKTPQVSIGMPVYNGGQFLKEALDALLAQTFKDFELIISDNASTDETEAICREYLKKDSRIRYFRNKENLGAAFNYNRSFDLALGEYFKWAAADDLCAPDYLEKCVEVLERHPEVVLCYPKTTIIDERGSTIRQYEDNLHLRSESVEERFCKAVRGIRMCNAAHSLIRSDILRKTRKIESYRGTDKVLLVELTLHGQFHEIPEYLFFRRVHVKASSSNSSQESLQEFFDPKSKGTISMVHWNMFFQHLGVIHRAHVRFSVKVLLVRSVLRGLITQRRNLFREPFEALRQVSRNLLIRTLDSGLP